MHRITLLDGQILIINSHHIFEGSSQGGCFPRDASADLSERGMAHDWRFTKKSTPHRSLGVWIKESFRIVLFLLVSRAASRISNYLDLKWLCSRL